MDDSSETPLELVESDVVPSSVEPRRRFRLTKSNELYLGSVAAFIVALFLYRWDWSPEALGRMTGMILAFLILPTVLAWIVYRLAKRDVQAGSVIFHAVLTLVLFGQVMTYVREKLASRSGVGKSENVAMSDMEANRRLLVVADEHSRESLALMQEWKDSSDRAFAADNFHLATKPDGVELDRRRLVFEGHAALTEKLLKYDNEAMEKLNRQCAELRRTESVVKYLDDFAKLQRISKARFRPLWEAHLKTFNALTSATKILRRNPDAWTAADGNIIFDDDELLEQYNTLKNISIEGANRIDELTARIRESP